MSLIINVFMYIKTKINVTLTQNTDVYLPVGGCTALATKVFS